MAKKLEKQIEISGLAKSKLKDIYKEVIIDEISEQLRKQHKDAMMVVEDSLKGNIIGGVAEKKQNKTILAKLEVLLIRMEMLESKEEKELQVLADNSKMLMIANVVLLVGLIMVILVKI